MNRMDLVRDVARRSGLPVEAARRALDALFGNSGEPGVIAAALRDGERVQLAGFGTFEARARAARVAFNPRTRERMVIPAVRAPAFRAGAAFKGALQDRAGTSAADGGS